MSTPSEFEVTRLLDTDTVALRNVRCRGECRHRSVEECVSTTHLVFPYRGVYLRHVGRDQAVADANHVLFFNAGEGYQVSHPMMGGDASLNVSFNEDGEGQWQDMLQDDRPLQDETVADAQESGVRHSLLLEAMESLNERERAILTERRLIDDPKTLEELSQVYSVSRERVRQIEVRAFEKLQRAMKSAVAAAANTPARNPVHA